MDNILIKFKEDLLKFDSDEKKNLIEENIKLHETVDKLNRDITMLNNDNDRANRIIKSQSNDLELLQDNIKEIIDDITDTKHLYMWANISEDTEESEEDASTDDPYDYTTRYITRITTKKTIKGIFTCKYLAEKYQKNNNDIIHKIELNEIINIDINKTDINELNIYT